ncbi:hypothetical protein PYW08_016826 [Mythimna loreyi]|uniref:Uncharacterized protein n=1 Tax=Mythimna loreyi TaxID=667449 RepID=A0ACC2QYE1_9NEOP|nr:hypothetical protein PYW08_016826 [Mythimna loreyi]
MMECCNDSSVSVNNILQCSVCNGKYHYECLNLTSDQFLSLNAEYKAVWKCPSCSNVNTPVRSYTELPPDDHSMDISCDNLDHTNFSTSSGLGCNKTLVTEMLSPSTKTADLEGFVANLHVSLSQWRNDMRKDMLKISDDIKSALIDIRKEMHTLRTEQTLLKQKVSVLHDDVIALQTTSQGQAVEYDILKKRVDDLSRSPASTIVESTISSLVSKIDHLEQQARQCNVEICNVPERRNENLPGIIEAMGNVLKCPVLPSTIVAVHRVPHAHSQGTGPKNIIVKLTTRLQRDNLVSAFRKAKSLKSDQIGIAGTSTPIYLNEHLTLGRKQLFRRTREVAKTHNYKYVWIKNGTILVRERDGEAAFAIRGDNDIKKIKIKTAN